MAGGTDLVVERAALFEIRRHLRCCREAQGVLGRQALPPTCASAAPCSIITGRSMVTQQRMRQAMGDLLSIA
jgi:hypothetical protein